jgi:hypothetical protein
VQTIRVWIEGFLRGRYGYEGEQVYRALAGLALIGAILVAGWLLIASLKASLLIPPVPRVSTEGPVVRNGVAAVVACGEKRSLGPMIASEPRTGSWWPDRQGDCTTWYHRPPGLEQRFNRHERAQ